MQFQYSAHPERIMNHTQMNTNEPPNDEPEQMIDEKAFLRKLREDPEFAAGMRAALKCALALPPTPEDAAMQEAARIALKSHEGYDVLGVMEQKMKASIRGIKELKDAPVEDGLRELNELLEAMTDDALDLPEPHRTNLIARLTKLRSL